MNKSKFIAIHEILKEAIKGSEFADCSFYVGGSVRDVILKRNIRNIDIVVSKPNGGVAFADFITKKLKIYKEGTNPFIINKQSGKVKFRLFDACPELGNVEITVSQTLRNDTCFGSLTEDAKCRDLTINALYCKIVTQTVFDLTHYGGDDLDNKVLRTPSNANDLLKEDPLKIIRIIRFASELGWNIQLDTWLGICKNVHRLSSINKDCLREEFNKLIVAPNAAEGIRKLYWCGALRYIIPELEELKELKQDKKHFEDAFDHTLTVLSKIKPTVRHRLAALFHDIGKATTRSKGLWGDYHFGGHEKESVFITEEILQELKYSKEDILAVCLAIKNHTRFSLTKNASNRLVRKFLDEVNNEEDIELCLDLIEANNTSKHPTYCIVGQTTDIKKKIALMEKKENELRQKLPVDGKDIMKAFNLPKGKTIGAAIKLLTEHISINPKMTKVEAINIVKDALEKEII